MAHTKATRPKSVHGPGQGPGWGGEAKGPGQDVPFTAENNPTGHAKQAGKLEKAERIAAHIERLERIAEAAERAERYNESISATNAVLDRLEGKPVARQEHSGPDGTPIQAIAVTFVRPEAQD